MVSILILSYFFCLTAGLSFTFKGVRNIKCFKLSTEINEEIHAAYLVSGLYEHSVLVKILDPDMAVAYVNQRIREGKTSLTALKKGKYSLCFESLDSSAKTISFEFFNDEALEQDSHNARGIFSSKI